MTELDRRRFLGAGVAGAGLAMLPVAAFAGGCVFPPSGTIRYRVLRKGEVIGEHRASFTRQGDHLIATNEIEIVVRLLGLPVYRYEHRSEEVWVKGWLSALESRTNKDGRKERLQGERRHDALRLLVDGAKKRSVAGYVITTSLWHRDTPFERGLLDIEDGWVKLVQSRFRGNETVPFGGDEISARHYAIFGEIARDVWYDDRCRLVRVEFNTKKDGSRIILEPVAIET